MASKSENSIAIEQASGVMNVFLNVLKKEFFRDAEKRIASISFMRNLVEHTKSVTDADYLELTSLLHRKPGTRAITQQQLDEIYKRVFTDNSGQSWKEPNEIVVDMIEREASECLKPNTAINFEHKIVLSIAIRLAAEKYMMVKINDDVWAATLEDKHTSDLLKRFEKDFAAETEAIKTLQTVLLMTPENIHLNAFMYEPIVDMSGGHLTKLYREVLALQ